MRPTRLSRCAACGPSICRAHARATIAAFPTARRACARILPRPRRARPLDEKFEAGTQDAAGIYATGAALAYLMDTVGYDAIAQRESALIAYAMQRMSELPFVNIIGPAQPTQHHGVVSFNVRGIHPHDVASILDAHGVCIRAGHHCAQPLLAWLGVENLACCRASFTFYNDASDVDAHIDGLTAVWRTFNG